MCFTICERISLPKEISVTIRQFTREEIVTNLRAKIARKEPIILGGAGTGLVAKIADRAGIDIIMAYNTGPFRMDGSPSCVGYLAYGDCNAITLDLGRRILPQVSATPVIGGIGAGDPYRDMDQLIEQMMAMGFSGITNVPTAGAYDGKFRHRIDTAGMGYPEEVKLIANCNRRNIFTVAYAYTADEVRAMVQAGVDVLSAHVGATSGGTCGYEDACSIDDTCRTTQELCEVARSERSDIIFVCHGGQLETPEDVQICFDRTDVNGFIGASSIERIPLEKIITETVSSYKKLKCR